MEEQWTLGVKNIIKRINDPEFEKEFLLQMTKTVARLSFLSDQDREVKKGRVTIAFEVSCDGNGLVEIQPVVSSKIPPLLHKKVHFLFDKDELKDARQVPLENACPMEN